VAFDYNININYILNQFLNSKFYNKLITKQFIQSINKSADESVHKVIPNIVVLEDVNPPVVGKRTTRCNIIILSIFLIYTRIR